MANSKNLRELLTEALAEEGAPSIRGLARRICGDGAPRQQVENKRALIHKYLRGEVRYPNPHTARELARALGKDNGYFMVTRRSIVDERDELLARIERLEAGIDALRHTLDGHGDSGAPAE